MTDKPLKAKKQIYYVYLYMMDEDGHQQLVEQRVERARSPAGAVRKGMKYSRRHFSSLTVQRWKDIKK